MLDVTDQADTVGRLLAGAAKTMQSVRYCWLMTEATDGGFNARPMGHMLPENIEDNWTIRCITGGGSRKARELRHDGQVGLMFQSELDEAYVMLSGRAALIERAADVDRLWKKAYDAYFPTPAARAAAAFVEIEVTSMELWIRGVTPEPFGMSTTRVARDTDGVWRLACR
jgi:general stress protein 26